MPLTETKNKKFVVCTNLKETCSLCEHVSLMQRFVQFSGSLNAFLFSCVLKTFSSSQMSSADNYFCFELWSSHNKWSTVTFFVEFFLSWLLCIFIMLFRRSKHNSMPGIGIGVSTPFSQPSNYQTVLNHRFRDETPFDPSKQLKMKCPYCGVWAKKGRECSLCGTRVPGGPPPQRMERARSKSPATSRREPRPSVSRQTHFDTSGGPAVTPNSRSGRAMERPSTPRNGGSSWEASIHAMSPGPSYNSVERNAQAPLLQSGTTPLRHGPDQHVRKVKCSYCGIWVPVGKYCTLCRTLA